MRNGYLPARKLVTPVGELAVQQPRVHDRWLEEQRERLSNRLLPPYLRTTNPIESTFATIHLRHRCTNGSGSRIASLTMIFRLAESVAKRWRLLNGYELLPDAIRGVVFPDGLPP